MWYKDKKFWLAVIGAVILVIAYFNDKLAGMVKTIGDALIRLVFVAVLTTSVAAMPACGSALPTASTVLSGITTAAQIFDLVENMLSPQYQEAQDACMARIETLPRNSEDLTAAVAACGELTDAWLAVLQAVDQLEVANRTGHQAYKRDIFEGAKQRIRAYNDSYIKYEWMWRVTR